MSLPEQAIAKQSSAALHNQRESGEACSAACKLLSGRVLLLTVVKKGLHVIHKQDTQLKSISHMSSCQVTILEKVLARPQ
ncbi:hypothetical protein SRHO_G00087420 [Serrasalmus rhombeus]